MAHLGLAGADAWFAGRLAEAAGEQTTLVPCNLTSLHGELPSAIVLGPAFPTDDALKWARQLDTARPDVGVIIVAEPDPTTLRAALQAGARDVWSPSMSVADLSASVHQVLTATDRRRTTMARHARESDVVAATHQVIVVLSPKGGAGKTMVSTNLAVGIAKATSEPVVLVDLDVQFGDVATALALDPAHTMVEAVAAPDNAAALKTLLQPHASGVHVLCAPVEPAAADVVNPDATEKIIKTLHNEFATVVVDTGAGLDEHTLAALDWATDLVLVSTTDIFAINGTRKLLEVLEAIDLGEPDRHLVLNRANARVNISRHEIESTLGCRVDVEIPSTRAVPMAMNRGESLFTAGRVARKPMFDLLRRFVEPDAAK